MGKFIPRSYNGFIVSDVVEDFQEEQWVTFSVNINAASTPPSTSQIIPVRDVAFHAGQRLDKCELDWKLLMRKILLVVDQSLCPTDQTKCTEDLWLDLDGDVEILGICKRRPYVPRQLPNLSDRISSKWNSTCEVLETRAIIALGTHKLPIGTSLYRGGHRFS